MEKSCIEMDDDDDWELLPVPNTNHSTFFEFGLESGKNLLISKETNYSPMGIVDNHYFILPYPKPQEIEDTTNSGPSKDETEEDLPALVFKDIGVDVPSPKAIFKNLKDDQFADMNVESHILITKGTITPIIIGPEPMLFDDDDEEEEFEEQEYVDHDTKKKPCLEVFGLKVWKWKLVGGVGALCSIGVAAATICVMLLGGCHQHKYEQPHSQRLQFQIYTDQKRIKQVMQQATRLNHTLIAVRGVPMTRANISFGGYYDGL